MTRMNIGYRWFIYLSNHCHRCLSHQSLITFLTSCLWILSYNPYKVHVLVNFTIHHVFPRYLIPGLRLLQFHLTLANVLYSFYFQSRWKARKEIEGTKEQVEIRIQTRTWRWERCIPTYVMLTSANSWRRPMSTSSKLWELLSLTMDMWCYFYWFTI